METKQIRASLAQASEEYLKLLAYVQDHQAGDLLEYEIVQRETGVAMNTAGKSKLRRAILRSHLEYAVLPNTGYRLAEATMAMGILTFRLVGIDNKVKRAERSQKVLQDAFLEELSSEEQKGILFVGAVFGAIRQSADKGKLLYRTEVKRISDGKPILPDNV